VLQAANRHVLPAQCGHRISDTASQRKPLRTPDTLPGLLAMLSSTGAWSENTPCARHAGSVAQSKCSIISTVKK
jgi:hypothetical protein